jgi:hypothetical protein
MWRSRAASDSGLGHGGRPHCEQVLELVGGGERPAGGRERRLDASRAVAHPAARPRPRRAGASGSAVGRAGGSPPGRPPRAARPRAGRVRRAPRRPGRRPRAPLGDAHAAMADDAGRSPEQRPVGDEALGAGVRRHLERAWVGARRRRHDGDGRIAQRLEGAGDKPAARPVRRRAGWRSSTTRQAPVADAAGRGEPGAPFCCPGLATPTAPARAAAGSRRATPSSGSARRAARCLRRVPLPAARRTGGRARG